MSPDTSQLRQRPKLQSYRWCPHQTAQLTAESSLCWAGTPAISRWHSPAQIVSLSSPLPLLHWFQGTVRALVTLQTRFHIGCFLLSVILGCHHSKWYFSIANKSISSTLPLKSGTGSQGSQLPMLLYLLLCQWRLQKPKEQHQVKDYPDAWQYKKLDRQRRRLH